MSEQTPETAPQNHMLVRFLEASAMPFFLFSLVLCSSLLLSQALLLPRLTRVTVAGKERDALSLRSYQADLLQELGTAEEKRSAMFGPGDDATFAKVRSERSTADLSAKYVDLVQLAASFAEADIPVVLLSEIHFDALGGKLIITGDVRNAGPGSLTVLASFRAEMEKLPWVKKLIPGTFERLEDPVLGIHSPLSIVAELQ